MFDHEDRHTRIANAPDHLDGPAHVGRVQTCQHFIEQQDPGPGRQRAGHFQPLHATDGEPACLGVQQGGQVGQFGDIACRGLGHRRVAGVHKGTQHDVLQHREAGERLHDLEGAPHPHPCEGFRARRAGPASVGLPNLDRAGVRPDESGELIEHRRLACAVGADDTEDFALVQRQRDVVGRMETAKALVQTIGDQQRLAARWPWIGTDHGRRRAGRDRRHRHWRFSSAWQAVDQPEHPSAQVTHQSPREEQHHQHQHDAVDEPMSAIAQRAQPATRQLCHRKHHDRSQQRTGHRAQSTDQREHGDLDRQFERERRRRLEERQVHGVEGAEHAGHGRRDHRRSDLDANRIDTDCARRIFTFAHCDQIEAESRVADQPAHPQRDCEETEGDGEVGPLLTEDHPFEADIERHVQAGRAPGQRVEMHHQ